MAIKYELTEDSIEFDGVTLYRVRALTSFGDVTAGDTGGYVDIFGRINIDDRWVGWVYDDAKVYGGSWIHENAKVRNTAIVRNKSLLYGSAEALNSAVVEGGSYGENVRITSSANVSGNTWSYGSITYSNSTKVSGGMICGTGVIEDY